jgi:hypothetical protein
VLAADVDLERIAKREGLREEVIDHGVDDHDGTMAVPRAVVEMA